MNEINVNGMAEPPVEETVDVELASPGRRMAAYLWNTVLTVLAYLPLLGAIIWPMSEYGFRAQGLEDMETLMATDWSMPWLLAGALVILVYTVWQLWWMSRDGQSIGKKIMGIRVVRTDGRNPGFWGTVLMREMVYNLLVVVVSTAAGYLAVLFAGSGMETADSIANIISIVFMLVCVVMLFNRSKDRRTIQDYLANTVVVRLPKR
ncbi:RDD family protein [Uruburuella testudinis]|uniref:RDD family protein n=1 Tax=Uruburuella testudinis TaxID=1282863 RepID=A0ABY4E017_9NEIS|nr:RDD family protein [Uruburuella testudinis]UOO82311.1 RDD family protein [Uruburuella testudinis]